MTIICWTAKHEIDVDIKEVYECELEPYLKEYEGEKIEEEDLQDMIEDAVENYLASLDDCDYYALTRTVYSQCEKLLLAEYHNRN